VNQQQMHTLLDVPKRTLGDWKKGNRAKLYQLLETLNDEAAQKILEINKNMGLKRVLENEKYYNALREFEKDLYEVLVSGRDSKIWLELSKNTALSKEARARAAYLYSFLTNKMTQLSFKSKVNVGLYHGNRNETGNGLARLYGLFSFIPL